MAILEHDPAQPRPVHQQGRLLMTVSQLGLFGSEFAGAAALLRNPSSMANSVPVHSRLLALQPAWNAAAISLSAAQSLVTGLRRSLVSRSVSAHLTACQGQRLMTIG